ncbi:MAG: RHS repeat-associated core domain-containing protein [Acidobacteriota bacterium]
MRWSNFHGRESLERIGGIGKYDEALNPETARNANQTMLQAFVYGSTNARLMDYDAVAGVNKLYASTGGTTLAEYTEFQAAVPTWTKSYTYLGDTQLATVTPNGGNENTEFNHPDRLGTRVITNQQTGGNSEQAHLPFGTALNAESSISNNNKRFTSYDRSAQTGLDYAVNRTYDSKQGRFTQVDPIGGLAFG